MDRSKILLMAFVVLIVLWRGTGIVSGVVFGPLNDRAAQIANLTAQKDKLEAQQQQVEVSEHKLQRWKSQSLPPAAQIATTVYQHWLIDLASQAKLEAVSVSPSRVATGNQRASSVFQRIGVSVKAEGNMEQLCQFLYDFYRADLLQRVAHLDVESTAHTANPKMKFNLTIEGLAMKDTPPRSTLMTPAQLKNTAPGMKAKTLADYKSLIAESRFVRGYNGPPTPPRPTPPPPTPAPPTPPFDSAPYVKLVASIITDGRPEAWLFDQSSNKQIILTEGGSFEVAGVKGACTDIEDDYVRLTVNDKLWRLELGKNLKELQEVDANGKPMPASSTTTPAAPGTATAPGTPTAAIPATTGAAATTGKPATPPVAPSLTPVAPTPSATPAPGPSPAPSAPAAAAESEDAPAADSPVVPGTPPVLPDDEFEAEEVMFDVAPEQSGFEAAGDMNK